MGLIVLFVRIGRRLGSLFRSVGHGRHIGRRRCWFGFGGLRGRGLDIGLREGWGPGKPGLQRVRRQPEGVSERFFWVLWH